MPNKTNSNYQQSLIQKFERIDSQINKMERGGHFIDEELENLKKMRLKLKDELSSN